ESRLTRIVVGAAKSCSPPRASWFFLFGRVVRYSLVSPSKVKNEQTELFESAPSARQKSAPAQSRYRVCFESDFDDIAAIFDRYCALITVIGQHENAPAIRIEKRHMQQIDERAGGSNASRAGGD